MQHSLGSEVHSAIYVVTLQAYCASSKLNDTCRCVCNNYDITGFWRNWHASFNKWIIRYLYVPLGGQQWRLLNIWVVFTFVALWHDLEWHLLRWAWMMALFLVPELICKAIINKPKWKEHWHKPWFLHLCAAFSAVYIAVWLPHCVA
jgi:protein-cysteine N-palmitoyltransferase HHAT